MTSPRTGLALTVLLALAACGDPPKPATAEKPSEASDAYDPKKDPLVNQPTMLEPYDAARATEDDWLISTCDGNPQTMSPLFASSTYEFRLSAMLFSGPFTFNAQMEWMPDPDVTEKLDTSPDGRVWTVKLKPGLTWHDGTPYTAHDIVYSWELQLDPKVPLTSRDGVLRIESVKALDDLTVQYVVKEPCATSKWDIYYDIVPKHLYEKARAGDPTLKQDDTINRHPVGSGPYKFVEWKENDKIVLERWDGWKGAPGHFKKIIFRIVPDTMVQLLTFEKGDTDEMGLRTKQFAVETVKSDAFKKVGRKATGPQWIYSYICWNQRGNPFFADPRVRRAMTMSVDLPKIISNILYNIPRPALGPFDRDSWMFDPGIQQIPFDLKAAARLLDEAGWKVDPETGWRAKDGNKFSFALLMPQGDPVYLEFSAVIQQDLKSIGVDMTTQLTEWATFQERQRKHDFQACTAAINTGTDPDTTSNQFATRSIDDGRNYGCYSNPKIDDLYVRGAKELDQAKRRKIYQEIGRVLYEDQPLTFMWSRPTLWAFSNRIRGVTFSPRGVWNFMPSFRGWWVAKNEQLYK